MEDFSLKEIIKNYKIHPSRGLGQNFLVNKGIIKKVIDAAELKTDDTVLEIGPGLGFLTKELAASAGKVITIEKDSNMCKILIELLEGWNIDNVKIINKDILKFDTKNYKLKPNSYKIVANLPFYLTAPVIRKFLEAEIPPSEMILIIQKEVAQRICAKPRTRTSSVQGSPPMNLLAVSIQFYATPKIISYISKNSFWPAPKVDSAIIKLTTHNLQLTTDIDLFFKIVKAGFSQPRKQLINNLKKLGAEKEEILNWLSENNIKPSQRAETLSINDWINLVKTSIPH